jgi:hypothetical protein
MTVGCVRNASARTSGASRDSSYGHRIVAERPVKAALISASCWAHAGYSALLRPAQIGSPMMRTRVPACSSANALRTLGMIRPGLRPASVMSRNRTLRARVPSPALISSRLGPGTATATGSPASSPSWTNDTVWSVYSRSER